MHRINYFGAGHEHLNALGQIAVEIDEKVIGMNMSNFEPHPSKELN